MVWVARLELNGPGQTSPIAGTIFASTKLPLRTWFRAMYHLTQEQSFAFSDQAGHLEH